MLIDSHCHLNMIDLDAHDGDLQNVLTHAAELNIGHFLCVSCDPACHDDLTAIADEYDRVSISVGLHPTELPGTPVDVDTLLRQAKHPKVVAIGETGLDTFHCDGDLKWQHERFESHIHVAHETGMPLIVHARDAKKDTIEFMKKAYQKDVPGVLHCFTEDWEMARKGLDCGFLISFSGIVTFKSATSIQQVAMKVPDDGYLVETDSPFLAPMPHRGKPNVPGFVRHVADYVAELRGQTGEKVANDTTENFKRLFPKAQIADLP